MFKGMSIFAGVFVCFIALSQALDSTPEGVPSRFDYKKSFKKPYFVQGSIPYFSTFGSVILSDDYIRLTPSVRSMQGSIWTSTPLPYTNWEVSLKMMISGRGKLGGDGVAFWYTSRVLGLGPALGSEPFFDGLMVGFDTYDNDAKRNNPYIFGMLNDGSMNFDNEKDGDQQAFAGCLENFRNTPVPVHVAIRYLDGTLKVSVDSATKGANFRTCFEEKDIALPSGYYFGLSAATGALADDHDILSFEVYELNPAPKQNPGHVENLSDEEQKRFEKVQGQVHQQQKAKDIFEFELDDNYKVFFGEALGKDEIIGLLSKINFEQEKVLEKLARLESMPPSQGNSQGYQTDSALRQSVNELSTKIFELQNELKNRLATIERNQINNQPNVQSNQQPNQQISEMKLLLEQTLNRLNRMETQPPQVAPVVQQLKEEIRRVQETVESGSGSNTLTVIISVIALLAIIALVAVSFKKSSDQKKFV